MNSGLTKLKQVIKDMVWMPFKHWHLGTSTTSLGSLFQQLTILLVKKCFLIYSLNFPGCSLEPFWCVLSLDTMEKRSAPSSPLLFLREQWDYLFFSPNYTSPKPSVTFHRTFLPALSLALLPPRGGCLQQEAKVEKRNRILYLRITVDIQDLETRQRVCIWFLEAEGI